MPFPFVPVALGGSVLALLLLSRKKGGTGNKDTPLPPPPPPNGGGTRPRRPPGPRPAGAGEATVAPVCGPNDTVDCRYGLLVHSTPDTDPGTRVAPPDSGPRSPHAVTGDTVWLLRNDVPDQSVPPTSRVWAQITTPLGNTGYVSYTDPAGNTNFSNITAPGGGGGEIVIGPATPEQQAVSGAYHPAYGFRPRHGGAQFTARCASPTGCWLRPAPNMRQRSNVVVPNGAAVRVLEARGGFAHVRYGNMHGWLPSSQLARG